MSELQARQFLTWKISEFSGEARSHKFRFQNKEWYLLLHLFVNNNYCELQLLPFQNESVSTSFRPFEVTCFAKTSNASGVFTRAATTFKRFTSNAVCEPVYIIKDLKRELQKMPFIFFLIFQDEDETARDVMKQTDEEPIPVVTSDLDSLSADLGSLLESGQVSDVQLKTNGRILSAHRAVLAARSHVFSAMFRSDMRESTSGQVDISDVDGQVMDLFLQYVYTGKIPDSLTESSTLTELYAVSDKYAVGTLKKLCRDRLTRQVSEDNYQELLALADAHSDAEFKDKVIGFVVENPMWLNVEKWFEFSKKHSTLAIDVYRKLYEKTYLAPKLILC